jgi:hypothetical protein
MPFNSNFNSKGLSIGQGDRSLTYFYGMSDFWSYLFQEKDKIELLLEATSVKLSDIYSKFLQLASTLSINDIEVATGQQVKLVVLKDTDLVDGEVSVYSLSEKILSSRIIANRLFLPTVYLEENIHYRVDIENQQIEFFQPISSFGFPTRVDANGSKEFALWFVDVVIDEELMYQYFGKLIGTPSEISTEKYKNYIYGLYFLYTHGPNFTLFRKGLNLILGVPLARDVETVLEVQQHPGTDQYIIVTDSNSYLIPFGLTPSVQEGDVLEPTEELAQWIEIKDWVSDDEWWLNFHIPEEVIPQIPPGETDRFARPGGYADYVMRNYLKKHTFFVNIGLSSLGDLTLFEKVSDIINNSKPAYTFPIYVFTVISDDTLRMTETLDIILGNPLPECEYFYAPIEKMQRDGVDEPLTRDCAIFTRNVVPYWPAAQLGAVEEIQNDPRQFLGGEGPGDIAKYINVIRQFRTNTGSEEAWLRTFLDGDTESFRTTRDTMMFTRGRTYSDDSGTASRMYIPTDPTQRVIFLYLTTQEDLEDKYADISETAPGLSTWTFTLFEGDLAGMTSNFSTFFSRGLGVYFGHIIPKVGYNSWSPDVGDLESGDYLVFIRVLENVVGAYWVTNNQTVEAPAFWVVKSADDLEIESADTVPLRGMGYWSGVNYLRGCGEVAGPTWTVPYSDTENTTPFDYDRSGAVVKINRGWR